MRTLAAVLPLAAALCALVPPPTRTPQDPQPAAAAAVPKADPADIASVEAITAALYDVISGPAGKARDWDRMRSLFHPDARLVPMGKGRDGAMQARVLTPADYIRTSGPFLEKNGFFEQEIARRVDAFGDFAHVFSTYEGRKQADDATPFLRGINSIQLVRQQDRWWVLQILWEQEHDAGPIPARYLPGGGAGGVRDGDGR